MDDIDRASELEQARLQSLLTEVRKNITNYNDEEINCTDCGYEIDEDRRRAVPSARRCLKCQDIYERPKRVRRF